MEKLKFLEIVPVKKDNCKEIIVLTHTKKQNYKPMSDVGTVSVQKSTAILTRKFVLWFFFQLFESISELEITFFPLY